MWLRCAGFEHDRYFGTEEKRRPDVVWQGRRGGAHAHTRSRTHTRTQATTNARARTHTYARAHTSARTHRTPTWRARILDTQVGRAGERAWVCVFARARARGACVGVSVCERVHVCVCARACRQHDLQGAGPCKVPLPRPVLRRRPNRCAPIFSKRACETEDAAGKGARGNTKSEACAAPLAAPSPHSPLL